MKRGRVISAIVPMLVGSAVALGFTVATAAAGTSHQTATAGAASASRTVVLDCLNHAQVRPKSFVLACADGNDYLNGLAWTSWGPQLASATGTEHVNDCIPYCAAGHFHSYPTEVIFWRSEPVAHHPGEKHFTRVTLLYPGSRPPAYDKNGRPVPGPDSLTGSLWN